MHRGRHNMDENDKSVTLLQPGTEARDIKLQMEQERVEREAASAIVSARRAFACRVVAIGFIVLFVILFSFKAMSESADQRRVFSSSCMHAMGGGVTGPRGSLLHFDARCTDELKEYFDQAYYSEVRRVSDQAIQYFRQQIMRHQLQDPSPGSRGTVIFDIDETALSNMDGFFGPSAWARFLGAGSPGRCVRPHLEYSALEPLRLRVSGAPSTSAYYRVPAEGAAAAGGDLGAVGAEAGAGAGAAPGVDAPRRPLCNAPPLRATLDLYNFLYDNNYTVVFLTGRSEDARAETEANLAEAGYGRRCAPSPAAAASAAAAAATAALSSMAAMDSYGSFDRHRKEHRRSLQQQQQDPVQELGLGLGLEQQGQAAEAEAVGAAGVSSAASASSSSSSSSGVSVPFAGLFAPPAAPPQRCYAELVMRQIGDERLASVFKSEARSRLVSGGHVLAGNIGDQFSDLVGQAAAAANFKLPNPVYTLL